MILAAATLSTTIAQGEWVSSIPVNSFLAALALEAPAGSSLTLFTPDNYDVSTWPFVVPQNPQDVLWTLTLTEAVASTETPTVLPVTPASAPTFYAAVYLGRPPWYQPTYVGVTFPFPS